MPKVSDAYLEARRNQILDAATACFAAHGVRETTIKQICDASGLSTGALYRYFDSKQAMLDAVYQRSMVQNRRFGEQLATAPDPADTLRALARGMVGFIGDPALRQEHHLTIRVYAEGLGDPAVAASYVRLQHDVVEQVTPLLRALQADGRMSADLDVEAFMWLLLCCYHGLRVQHLLDPSLDLERMGDALVAVVDAALIR